MFYFTPTGPSGPLQTVPHAIIPRTMHQNRFSESGNKSPQSAPNYPPSQTKNHEEIGLASSGPPLSRQPEPAVAKGPQPRTPKKPGDGKKCRKIFGINNREAWCNACKWKKACVKYPD